MRHLLIAALPLAFLSAAPASAQIGITGTFTASGTCEAGIALAGNNPDGASVSAGESFQAVAVNKADFTHYLIVMPDAAQSQRRWVAQTCGTVDPAPDLSAGTGNGSSGSGGGGGGGMVVPEPDSIEHVLAASWQPGFCATNRGQSKVECQTQHPLRPDARQFSIHGLWPDDLDTKEIFPCYCTDSGAVSCRGGRSSDAVPDLSPPVRAALEVLMPGAKSDLEDHEWAKHGTCYERYLSSADQGATADEYFNETMILLQALNDSGVRDLFVERLGQVVTAAEIEGAFDAAFGADAGRRVLVRCNSDPGERIITELWISLKGEVTEDFFLTPADLGALILAAPDRSVSTNSDTCESGLVVAVQ